MIDRKHVRIHYALEMWRKSIFYCVKQSTTIGIPVHH